MPVTGNTFTMPNDDVTVSATFEYVPPVVVPTTYTVTTSSSVGGSVTATPSTGLNYGETVTITVQPYDGYYLKSLTVGGEDVTNLVTWDWYWNWYYGRTGTYSFAVTGNTSVVAEFATWYDGDIACIYDGRFGNVSLNVWSQALDRFVPYTSASKGDLVQVIVEPYNGYAMNSLSISERNYWGSSVDYWQSWKHDNVYYFYMPDSDVNLYVDFTEAVSEHIVYVDRAANGSLKADTTWAADGQIVYVTATPDTGYVLSSLFVKTAKGDQLKVYEAKKAGVYYFYMPDQYVTVSAYFAPAASALPFNDVAYTSWYYDAVKFVYDKGIMDGVSYYKFAPDATITRGMVVTMLWRMAGEPYEAAAGFTDVAAGRYYTTAVAWAARNGIVEGMTATTFAPDQAITREQLASILYRYAKWLGFSGYGSDISGYTDAGKVSSYAYDAMSWAVRSGVVTGTSARVLDPQGTASRAAAAQMFMNFYNYIK
ncbi:MAG: S-layer homology domain-containing protein [Firmicutes bacterium]|nr:S-layer homology domain-containing protein [Bacillota bacterium]